MARSIIGLVDGDSYVKWAGSLLSTLGDDWRAELALIRTPNLASDRQIEHALAGLPFSRDELPVLTFDTVLPYLEEKKPDAVLLGCSPKVASWFMEESTNRLRNRPVHVVGLPGITTPPKLVGLQERAPADLFILQSHREIREHQELAASRGYSIRFGLATLPFLYEIPPLESAEPDRVVFAAQAAVPRFLTQRQAVIDWLVDLARRHPELKVVLKIRATAGEVTGHPEQWPYVDLIPEDAPENFLVESGPMAHHLARAVGLVAISSTSILEAIALDVPVLVLSDFGVSRRLINTAFRDSGLLGDHEDLLELRFHHCEPEWKIDNYFHPQEDNNWIQLLNALAVQRDEGGLPRRKPVRSQFGGMVRRAWYRKLAFGEHDPSRLGAFIVAVGKPVTDLRRSFRKAETRRKLRKRMRENGAALTMPETAALAEADGADAVEGS